MGNYSPTRFRRKGRIAFENGETLDDNPYLNSESFYGPGNAENWKDGWEQAKTEHEIAELMERGMEEYMVIATYSDGSTEEVGSIDLHTINSCHDMPIELEIDGITYKPEF